MRGGPALKSVFIALLACSPTQPVAPLPADIAPTKTSVASAIETDPITRRPQKLRTGEIESFKLARTACTRGSDFIEAIKNTAPLVVGVAAGELIDKYFRPRESGTGIILSKSGLILAHYHTIRDFNSVRVRLRDGTVKQAEWMGEDRQSDLVLLKIEGSGFPTPNLASADTLSIGQWVSSLGSHSVFSSP